MLRRDPFDPFLLSNPVTLVKLTAAAAERGVFTPIEEAVGSAVSKLVLGLAERAPREGGFNAKAEAKAITEAFTKGMADAAQTLKTGKSDLDILYGKGRDGAVRESDVMPHSFIDFFGRIHGFLKAPIKRAEFTRSFEKRIEFYIRQGLDVSDPMIQMRVAVEAYKDANRSVFLQDNIVVDAYNRGIAALEQKNKATGEPYTAGVVTAGTAKALLPIVRIPTNIVAETFQYATGLATGSMRYAAALRKGIDALPPEKADLIMRELKKGSLGAATLLLGYLNAESVGGFYSGATKHKADEPKFGSIRLFGHDVPSYLLHNPLLEVLQIGATVRKVADSKVKGGGTEGLASGAWAAALGLIEEVPFAREAVEAAKLFNPREREHAAGELVKSVVVPQVISTAAEQLDKDSKGVIPRKPTSVVESVETGIPGLRETVKPDLRKEKARQ